jgi:predicted MPP superfamily phosphohydrolase
MLNPDLVLIAGDLVSDRRIASRHYDLAEAVRPLAGLRARRGVFAVLGNHDHWRNAGQARKELAAAGVIVLDNEAVRVGPLAIGGLDDAFTVHHDLGTTVDQLRRLGDASILLSHSPDPFPDVPSDIQLMLAGHTHCGQIRLPLVGAISTMSDYGERYACGRIDENGKTLIVSAGLGTSIMPLRLGAAPDIWLVRLSGGRPKAGPPAAR